MDPQDKETMHHLESRRHPLFGWLRYVVEMRYSLLHDQASGYFADGRFKIVPVALHRRLGHVAANGDTHWYEFKDVTLKHHPLFMVLYYSRRIRSRPMSHKDIDNAVREYKRALSEEQGREYAALGRRHGKTW